MVGFSLWDERVPLADDTMYTPRPKPPRQRQQQQPPNGKAAAAAGGDGGAGGAAPPTKQYTAFRASRDALLKVGAQEGPRRGAQGSISRDAAWAERGSRSLVTTTETHTFDMLSPARNALLVARATRAARRGRLCGGAEGRRRHVGRRRLDLPVHGRA